MTYSVRVLDLIMPGWCISRHIHPLSPRLWLQRLVSIDVHPRPRCGTGKSPRLVQEVAVLGTHRSTPAWCVRCGVHPPPPSRFGVGVGAPCPPSAHSFSACRPVAFLPWHVYLRLLLCYTRLPLCAGPLWLMLAVVRRDFRFHLYVLGVLQSRRFTFWAGLMR